MFSRPTPLLALVFLSACTASSGETATTTSSAYTSWTLANVTLTPTDTTMTIAFGTSGDPLPVTLGGQTVTATPITSATQNQSVTFTGLTPCTSYGWTIPAWSGPLSGQTNTRATGNTACATTEPIAADVLWDFIGEEHQEEQNIGCGGWSSNWPVGYGWRTGRIGTEGGAFEFTGGQFGFQHTSNGSSWCAESTVHVWRMELQYHISPQRWARGVTDATMTADYTTVGTPQVAGDTLCASSVTQLRLATFGQNSQGPEWAPFMGGAETDVGLMFGDHPYPLHASATGGKLEVRYGTPSGAWLVAGFEAPRDGFADLTAGASKSWAVDNDHCVTILRNAALNLTYAPMPPETPICTAAVTCSGATVTCNPSPEVFQLLASNASTTNRLVGTFDGTGGATPSFTDPGGSQAETYTACTRNADGAKACAPVRVGSAIPCPPPPPPPLPAPIAIEVPGGRMWTAQTVRGVVTLNEAPATDTTVTMAVTDPLQEGRATGVTLQWVSTIVHAGTTSAPFTLTSAATALPWVTLEAQANGHSLASLLEVDAGLFVMTFDGTGDDTPFTIGTSSALSFNFRNPAPAGSVLSFVHTAPNVLSMTKSFPVPAGATAASVPVQAAHTGTDKVTATYEGTSAMVFVSAGPLIKAPPPPRCHGSCQ